MMSDSLANGGRAIAKGGNSLTEVITSYGMCLIENGGVSDSECKIAFGIDDLEPVFEHLAVSDDAPFCTGFLAVVPLYIFSNWASLSLDQIVTLKSNLIRSCNRQYSTALSHQFTNFVADVMRVCNGDWPEIHSFVLNEAKFGEMLAFLVAKIVRLTDEETLARYKFKLRDRILEIFPRVSKSAKLRLLRAINDLKLESMEVGFLNTFWMMIIEILRDDDQYDLKVLFGIVRDIFITNGIEFIDFPKLSDEDEFISFIPFITLWSDATFVKVLSRIIEIVKEKSATEFPSEIGDRLAKSVEFRFTPVHADMVISVLKENNQSKALRTATVFVLVPFLKCMIHEDTNLEEIGVNWFSEFAFGMSFDQRVWLYSIINLLPVFREINKIPANTQSTIISLIQSSNEVMQDLAFRALRTYFENMIVRDLDQLRPIFNSYSNLNAEQRFKYIHSLAVLVECGGFDVSIVQVVVDFIRASIRQSSDAKLQSAFLALLGSLSNVSSQIVLTFVKETLPVVQHVINSKMPEVLPDAADILRQFVALQPALSRRTLAAAYPKILAFAKSNSSDTSLRCRVALVITELVESHYKKKELSNMLALLDTFLASKNRELIITAAKMVVMLGRVIDKGSIPRLFSAMTRAAMAAKDEDTLNSTVKAMQRLTKMHSASHSIVARFCYWILSSSQPIFEKQAIWDWICPKTTVFPFITHAIEKYAEHIPPLIPYLVTLCNNCSDSMFALVFDSLAAAYGIGLVKTLPSQRLYDICYRDVFQQHSTVSLSYVLEKVTDDISDFTADLCKEWSSIKKNQVIWRCAVSEALFKLAARKQRVDINILQLILEEFPYKPEYGYGESMSKAIVSAFNNNPDLEVIELTLLKKFSDFFMLEQSDFLAYRVDYDTQMEMKTLMREIYNKNRQYEREMMKYYAGNKVKINKFVIFVQ